jgi:hypothetical protein
MPLGPEQTQPGTIEDVAVSASANDATLAPGNPSPIGSAAAANVPSLETIDRLGAEKPPPLPSATASNKAIMPALPSSSAGDDPSSMYSIKPGMQLVKAKE